MLLTPSFPYFIPFVPLSPSPISAPIFFVRPIAIHLPTSSQQCVGFPSSMKRLVVILFKYTDKYDGRHLWRVCLLLSWLSLLLTRAQQDLPAALRFIISPVSIQRHCMWAKRWRVPHIRSESLIWVPPYIISKNRWWDFPRTIRFYGSFVVCPCRQFGFSCATGLPVMPTATVVFLPCFSNGAPCLYGCAVCSSDGLYRSPCYTRTGCAVSYTFHREEYFLYASNGANLSCLRMYQHSLPSFQL